MNELWRNAKLVANSLITDTCLNALKWCDNARTHTPIDPQLRPLTYMGQRGARQTMTSNYPSARTPLPPPATQLHPDLEGAHPSRRDKDRRLLSDRQQRGHMEGRHAESGITVMQCTPRIALRWVHTVKCTCMFTGTQITMEAPL